MEHLITKQEKQWLYDKYPLLTINAVKISGTIEFEATYNNQTGKFMILGSDIVNIVGGRVLSGKFNICIEERKDKSLFELPVVYIEGIDTIIDRHFNQTDKSACLCSPLEEKEYLTPGFNFPKFLEELVIPFLYGQAFYSIEQRWPWGEYGHGAIGLLESYFKLTDPAKAEDCLKKLSKDKVWPKIKSALEQKSYIKGHTPCFCPKMDKIKRCHPKALRGLWRLWLDIKTKKLYIPK